MGEVEGHVFNVHNVDLSGRPPATGNSANKGTFQIRRVQLANGERRLVCPYCVMQFEVSDQLSLLKHAAEEHGQVCSSGDKDMSGQSDHLDLLYAAPSSSWYRRREEVLRRYRIVSLGSFCSMKMSLQKLGLGESHLPFDWIRTTSQGIRHFVSTGFQDFFTVATKCQAPGSNLTMFRSQFHSVWHDDLLTVEARLKLTRRIERFLAIKDDPRDLIFVRSCASSDEVGDMENLQNCLVARFGRKPDGTSRRVLLGLVVDGQDHDVAAIVNAQQPTLMLATKQLTQSAAAAGPCYCEEVTAFLNWALSLPVAKTEGAAQEVTKAGEAQQQQQQQQQQQRLAGDSPAEQQQQQQQECKAPASASTATPTTTTTATTATVAT